MRLRHSVPMAAQACILWHCSDQLDGHQAGTLPEVTSVVPASGVPVHLKVQNHPNKKDVKSGRTGQLHSNRGKTGVFP